MLALFPGIGLPVRPAALVGQLQRAVRSLAARCLCGFEAALAARLTDALITPSLEQEAPAQADRDSCATTESPCATAEALAPVQAGGAAEAASDSAQPGTAAVAEVYKAANEVSVAEAAAKAEALRANAKKQCQEAADDIVEVRQWGGGGGDTGRLCLGLWA